MGFIKDMKKLGKLFKSEEEQAEAEAYRKEAVKQAKLRGERRAKADYKEKVE